MALYAFDGTGNEDQDRDEKDSNVVNFFNAYIDPKKNIDPDEKEGSLYLKGIGYSYREIAQLTNSTYTAVNRRITEGRAALRRPDRIAERPPRAT